MGRIENNVFSPIKRRLESFFMGRIYPLFVGLMVVISYCFGLEAYMCTLNVLTASLSLFVCNTARPLILFVISFVFQVSAKNSPGVPSFSDYYFTSWRLPLVFILGAVLVSSAVYFAVKNKIFSGISFVKSPLLLPLSVLTVALSVGGIFSGEWRLSGLVYGLCNGVCLSLVFIFFYFGLKRDNKKELVSYFVYVSAILAFVLFIELAHCYIVNEIKFDLSSMINVFEKEKMNFGWGVSNTMGVSLTVLIPALLLGFYEKWGRFFYVPLAFAVYFASFLSMSRNAMLFGTVTLILSIAVILFSSKYRKIYAIIAIPIVIATVVFAVVYKDILIDKFTVFFTDNGRYRLWEHGIENFLKAPVFGVGFFGFDLSTFVTAEFLPTMAHQTFVQLLSATGLFGLLSYIYYRVMSIVPIVRRPSAVKFLLALSAGAMLFESLLDNFIFYFLPTLHYSIAFAILFAVYTGEKEEIKN